MRNLALAALALFAASVLGPGGSAQAETPPAEKAAPDKKEAKEVPAETATATLQLMGPDKTHQLPYSKSRPLDIESTVPRMVWEVPKTKAKDRVFFRFAMANMGKNEMYAVLDRSAEDRPHDTLYLDRNMDLDLTNDGAPVSARIRLLKDSGATIVEFLDHGFSLPYSIGGTKLREPYRTVFFFFTKGTEAPQKIYQERYGWREGKVTLRGQEYLVCLVDDDNNGIFTEGDTWGIVPTAKGRAALLGESALRSVVYPSWSADEKWMISSVEVDPAGRTLSLKSEVAKESEKEYITKLLRRRQSPQERALKIDPLRPKAAPKEQVQWVRQGGLKEALRLGQRLKRRVLLEYVGPRCPHCVNMARFTFRDKEVVALSKKYICVKLAVGQGPHEVAGTPTYYVLENDGSIVEKLQGFRRPTEFVKWLKALLN